MPERPALHPRQRSRRRSYVVTYEKVDVWAVTVEASSKKEARRKLRAGEFDLDDTYFCSYSGEGRILDVERDGE